MTSPTSNPDAERGFLGSMLIDPNLIPQATIRPDQFQDAGRRDVWTAILALHRDGREIDPLTVHGELTRMKSIFRPSEIPGLLSSTPTPQNWKEYQTDIVEACYRRTILQKASDLAKLANEPGKIVGKVSGVVNEITEATPKVGKGLRPLHSVLNAVSSEVEDRAKNPREIFGIATGFADFDLITGGWQKGQLLIVAGEPGIGKTRWVTQAATYATREETGVIGAVFTAEMNEREIALRMISVEGGINLRNMETGYLKDDDWTHFYDTLTELSTVSLLVDDTSRPTPDYIDSEIARLKASGIVLDFVVVDYIFLLVQTLIMENKALDEVSASQIVTARLKQTAKDFNTAVVAISSITKANMDSSSARMSSLRGSGQQVHDGDSVLFLTADETDPSVIHNRFVKGRHLKRRLEFELINDTTTPKLLNATARVVNLNNYSNNEVVR